MGLVGPHRRRRQHLREIGEVQVVCKIHAMSDGIYQEQVNIRACQTFETTRCARHLLKVPEDMNVCCDDHNTVNAIVRCRQQASERLHSPEYFVRSMHGFRSIVWHAAWTR